MADRDVVVALSTPGPGVLKPEWIKNMNRDPIVFACANPVPENLALGGQGGGG